MQRNAYRILECALFASLALGACSAPGSGNSDANAAASPAAAWLTGRVVDATGAPVANVPVAIHGGLATRWRIGETTTDADGQFEFRDRVQGAAHLVDEPGADYVGVCAGRTVGSFNPPTYLPWVDVNIEAGKTGECTLVLDRSEVERKLASLRAR